MKRIKYTSRFSSTWTAEQLGGLVAQSSRNNAARDVTGMLMTTGGLFFQVLEGPDDCVDELFARIRADTRHTDVVVLKTETDITRRLFPDWSMRGLVLDPNVEDRLEPLHAMLQSVVVLQGQVDSLAGALERSLWAELSGAHGGP